MIYETKVYELVPTDDQRSYGGKAKVGVHENGVLTLYSYYDPVCTMNGDIIIRHQYGLSETTAKHVKSFCNLDAKEFEKIQYIDYHEIRQELNNMKREFVPEVEILERFDGLEELTDEQERFLTGSVIPFHLFYRTDRRYAYCTACRSEVDIRNAKGIRHKKEAICPKCGAKVIANCLTYGNNFSDSGTGVIMSRLGNDIIIRYYDVCRSYANSFINPYGYVQEVVRDVFHGDGIPEVYDRKERWQIVRRICSSYSGWHWGMHVRLLGDNVRLYTANLGDVLKGTRYEHCELGRFAENVEIKNNAWVYGDYLAAYEKTPMWEWLMKMGMYGFAQSLWQRVDVWYSEEKSIDQNAKTLQDMLKITRMQLADLKAHPDTPSAVLNYLRKGMTFGEYEMYRTDDFDRYDTLLQEFCNVFPYRSALGGKFRRWFDESKKPDMRTYIDYLRMAKAIGWDVKSEFVLYPKELQKSHDMATKVYNERKAEIQETAMARIAEEMKERFAFTQGGLQIVVPATASAIANEGVKLHHCVGTYIDKVVKGETNILFVRKLDAPSVPYYTMEVGKSGRIVQCRGQNNCGMTEEVKEFVKEFCKAKKIQQTLVA